MRRASGCFGAALCAVVLAAGPSAVAAQEHQAEHAETPTGTEGAHARPSIEVVPLIASFVNFFILVGLIVLIARRPLGKYLAQRRSTIETALSEAMRLRMEAESKRKEYAARLEHLSQELAQIRGEILKAGEVERDRIVADAEAKAARMRRETEFLIEQQMKQLRVDLLRDAVEASVLAASEVLVRQTSPADQERLAQRYIGDLKALGPIGDRPMPARSVPPPASGGQP